MLGATSTAELTLRKKLQELAAERSGCLAWNDDPWIECTDKNIIQKLVLELNKHPEIISLNLSGCNFQDEEAWLGKLEHIHSLNVSYSSIAPQALLAIANNENIQRLTMEGPIFGTKAKKLLDQFVQETKQSIVKLGGRNERLFQKLELWGALEKRTAENEKKAVALKENANSKIHPFSSAPASVLHKPAKTDGVQSGGFLSGMGDYFKLSS